MKLIEKLKDTSKWDNFKKWYNKEYKNLLFKNDENLFEWFSFYNFCEFPFEFQQGIFSKFIESESIWNYVFNDFNKFYVHKYSLNGNDKDFLWRFRYVDKEDEGSSFAIDRYFGTFQELLIWYFNER